MKDPVCSSQKIKQSYVIRAYADNKFIIWIQPSSELFFTEMRPFLFIRRTELTKCQVPKHVLYPCPCLQVSRCRIISAQPPECGSSLSGDRTQVDDGFIIYILPQQIFQSSPPCPLEVPSWCFSACCKLAQMIDIRCVQGKFRIWELKVLCSKKL